MRALPNFAALPLLACAAFLLALSASAPTVQAQAFSPVQAPPRTLSVSEAVAAELGLRAETPPARGRARPFTFYLRMGVDVVGVVGGVYLVYLAFDQFLSAEEEEATFVAPLVLNGVIAAVVGSVGGVTAFIAGRDLYRLLR